MKIASPQHFFPGLIIGGALYVFVGKFEFLGSTCYYIGSLTPDTPCIVPIAYYGFWLIAAALVGYGLFRPLKPKAPPGGGASGS